MTDEGTFCWYELMTADVERAAAFYGAVFDWRCESAGVAGVDYRRFMKGDRSVGGLMQAFEGGPPPSWTGYVLVGDVDAKAAQAEAAGATIHRAPMDIPGVGRFAIMADPQGSVLAMIQVVPPPPGTPPNMPAGWHELHTTSVDDALGFHLPLWGWNKGHTMNMGPNGVYQMLARDGADFGAVLSMAGEPPHWLFYFDVDGIDAAIARVADQGGSVMVGPHEVPTGQWIALCRDPDGAGFAMVAPVR